MLKKFSFADFFINIFRALIMGIVFLLISNFAMIIVNSLLSDISSYQMQFYSQIILIFLLLFYTRAKKGEASVKKIEMNRNEILNVLMLIMIMIAIRFILYYIFLKIQSTFGDSLLEKYMESMKTIGTIEEVTIVDMLFNITNSVILAPVLEELYFRKMAFKQLNDKASIKTIIVISAFAFGILHSFTWVNLLGSIVAGLFMATIYAITNNLIYPIIIHSFNNSIPYITTLLTQNSNMEQSIESYINIGVYNECIVGIIISLSIVILIGVYLAFKGEDIINNSFKERVKDTFRTEKTYNLK